MFEFLKNRKASMLQLAEKRMVRMLKDELKVLAHGRPVDMVVCELDRTGEMVDECYLNHGIQHGFFYDECAVSDSERNARWRGAGDAADCTHGWSA